MVGMKRMGLAALTLGFMIVGLALVPSAASADTTGPARILIVGDSVTQGRVGDYTWRYRLWETLQAEHRAVDFVGPHTGLFDPTTTTYDNPGYADPNFDQDHAARWGGSMYSFAAIDGEAPAAMVTTYRPDVVINALGINDLTYTSTPSQLIDRMSQFVADARSANPQVSVILGQLTQTWHLNGAGDPVVEQYNTMLSDLAGSLDQPGARVVVAARPADYVEYVDTYDPAHPTAQGEVKLAAQYGDALRGLGLPTIPAPSPPVVAYVGAAHVAAVARPRAARLTFTTPAGATKQAVWKRDATAGSRWHFIAYVPPGAHSYRAVALHRHHRYVFRLRAYDGTAASTSYSNRVAVRVR